MDGAKNGFHRAFRYNLPDGDRVCFCTSSDWVAKPKAWMAVRPAAGLGPALKT
jgi:hypothetical protein